MDTFTVTRDIVFDDDPWIILREENLATMRATAKKDKNRQQAEFIRQQANSLEQARKEYAAKIKAVNVVLKKPTPEDRVEIRSACRDNDGLYNNEREPIEACVRLIQSWDLQGMDGKELPVDRDTINTKLPLALLDALWGELQIKLYPGQARLAFLAPWGG